MMLRKIFLSTLYLIIIIQQDIYCTDCGRCESWKCPTLLSLSCPGGTVKNDCSCCYQCGLLEGESCGENQRICGKHLYCRKSINEEKNGVCTLKNDITVIGKLGLPLCDDFKISSLGEQDCGQVPTTFCFKDCSRCCTHRTKCNPNKLLYQDVDKCKIQQVSIHGLVRKLRI